ncbi:MAG: S8 family serine peptidase [Pseudomonadales bacterium]|nr:S8 family serine peptidase [Pseudomonadales bacterium]
MDRVAGIFALTALVTVTALSPSLAFANPPDDPYYSSQNSWQQGYPDQWGLHAIGFTDTDDSAWNIENGIANPVIVAVLDTGLDYFHPDLDPANIWQNRAEIDNGIDDDNNGYVDDILGWNFVEDNNNPWDFSSHGTHVAGIIGAASNNGQGVSGINWGVQIMALKVMNFTGRGRTVPLAGAIYYAVDNGAKVINLSLGAVDNSLIQKEAIDYAHKNGVLVVVAAGNANQDTAVVTPAGLDNVVTVAAVTPDGERAGFSNWGDAVDIAAPGVDILSLRARRTDLSLVAGLEGYEPGQAFVGQQNRYYRATGTSFAAPFVSGAASLLYAQRPNISPVEVKRLILQSAQDIDTPGSDLNTGYGALDIQAALSADTEFYLDAALTSVQVTQQGKKAILQTLGSVAADKLKKAWIEIGSGEQPKKWTKVGSEIKKSITEDVLNEIDAKNFSGSSVWILKLVAEHKNGRQRESRFVLNLN